MQNFTLYEEFISLGQVLKDLGMVNTGGQAKLFLADMAGKIFVNQEAENRRGKKLRSGDVLEIPTLDLALQFNIATATEITEFEADKREEERVKALVKKMNSENKSVKNKKPAKPHFPGVSR